jgi:Ca2+-binding RTX toxin-like protein
MTSSTVTTLNGVTIPGTISGITVHTWTADSNGLYSTTTDLQAEWKAAYAAMLAGNGAALTPLQRMEGNAEAVLENTNESKQLAYQQAEFRMDAQREFDAIYAAMQMNQTLYGINPNAQFNTYTYLKLEQTLQDNPEIETLGLQGHGLNTPPSSAYEGYTNEIQNNVDGKTYYVGGGVDNGQLAIASFFDDVVMTHAPFPVVWHNGVQEQLNQNGNFEDPLSSVVAAANNIVFDQVLVASDFSTNSGATGAYVAIPSPTPAPPLPTPAAPLQGVTTLDGSVVPETITGLTVHTWTANAQGLYETLTNLGAEWSANYAAMTSGDAGNLTPLQRLEGNAWAVLQNTAAVKLTGTNLADFESDAQREFDAIDAAMRIDQTTYGTDPNAPFTATTYLQLEETLQSNETLEELAVQGHGLNSPPSSIYEGYTTDFQNRVDGSTDFVGGGADNGQNAIANFFDDIIMTHAPFPVVWHNGVQEQLNQNGNFEDTLATVVADANQGMFDQVFVASDFSTVSTATGAIVTVSGANSPATYRLAALDAAHQDGTSGETAYTFTVTRGGDTSQADTLNYVVAGSGSAPAASTLFVNQSGTVAFAAGATSATITIDVIGTVIPSTETFAVTISGSAGTDIPASTATGTIQAAPSSGQVTVTGAGGAVLTLNLASAALAAAVQPQLTALDAAIAAGSVVTAAASGGTLPTLAPGTSGLAEIDSGANVMLPAGYNTAIDLASNPTSLIAAGSGNQLVIASGTGDLTYAAAAGADTVYAGSGNALLFGGAASLQVFGGGGATTLIGGNAGNTVTGGGGNQLVFGDSTLNYTGGTGAATLIGGSGNTVAGGSGNLLVFASSSLTFTGGAGAATIIGGSGPLNATLGQGGGLVFGSPGGGDVLESGPGTAILVGGGDGDQVIATGAGNDTLIADAGAETLNGAAGTGNLVLFGGSGPDALTGGSASNLVIMGTGNETLTSGGSDNFVLSALPSTARVDLFANFNTATDAIGLFGFGGNADAAALASATTSGGNTTVTLSDGTTLVFAGGPTLTSNNFF